MISRMFLEIGLSGRKGVQFCICLTRNPNQPIKLVVPSSLQIGWVESPPYFGAASRTVHDVATQGIKCWIGTLEEHKFIMHEMEGNNVNTLPDKMKIGNL